MNLQAHDLELLALARRLARASALYAFALLACLSYGSRASAQSIAERVQLGLRSGVLDVRYGTNSQLDGYGSLSASLGLGGVGTSVGYAFDEHWLATLGATVSHDFSEDPSFLGTTTYSARPGVAYVFAEGSTVRPLLGMELNVGRATNRYFDEVHAGPAMLGGVQLHFSERLSLEPTLSAGYQYSRVSVRQDEAAVTRDHTHALDVTGWLGLSAWL